MKATTGFDLIEVQITPEEKRALTALLYSGVTNGALDKLGLQGLTQRLSACFNGPWEYEHGKDKIPTLDTYGCTNNDQNIDVKSR